MRPWVAFLIGAGVAGVAGFAAGRSNSYIERKNSEIKFENGVEYMHDKYDQDFGTGLEIRALVEQRLRDAKLPFDRIVYAGSASTDLKVPLSGDPKDPFDPNEYIASSKFIRGSGFYIVFDKDHRPVLIIQVQPPGLLHNEVTIIAHRNYSDAIFSQKDAMTIKQFFEDCAGSLMKTLPRLPSTISAKSLLPE